MKLIVIGPQGSGKGTQAERLAKHYKVPHIDVGELLREHVELQTSIGKRIEPLLKAGKLIPTDITNEIVQHRLGKDDAKSGWILDGYPRELDQAEFLDSIDEVTNVLVIDISEETSVKRIEQRRVCANCHNVYGIHLQPKNQGVCDKCEGQLEHRDDDKPDAIRKRLAIYHDETEPLIDYYKPRDIVVRVNGEGDIEPVFKEIVSILG